MSRYRGGADGTIVTQFTMTTLEELGLLKMDFLGLRTHCHPGRGEDDRKNFAVWKLDLEHIDYDDKKVMDSLRNRKERGRVPAGKRRLQDLHEGIEADYPGGYHSRNLLYRPGPMDFIPKYLKGKNDPGIHHLHLPAAGADLKADLRLYRLPGAGHADRRDLAGYPSAEATLCAVPCRKKRRRSWRKERQNFVYGNEEEGVKGLYRQQDRREDGKPDLR